ncbi:VanZ family protein [Luteolibacter yonseiensis]|uniref:VanZ family protein n=1 Tax=Luteolibacter yonseiensis TaxID=1144680 RepID=A0A934V5X6_9BACT|nr:VanZ family protein [Luteolibacter yonseiensis]MBK1814417.1 VanZ family protein [Luteolibacter yonseiensis]
MRRLTLFGMPVLLLAALFFLWQFRFERVPGYPTLQLRDLKLGPQLPPGAAWTGTETSPVLRLSAAPGVGQVVLKPDIPQIPAVDHIHVTLRTSSQNLEPGAEKWEDGRGIIEWSSPISGEVENDPIFSLTGTSTGKSIEQVMRPEKSPATPALRFENLGSSGFYEISQLEITVVRERWLWKIGRWFLISSCFAWALAWCRCGGRVGLLRASAAAFIWLFMFLYFVVPGPWKSLHPLAAPFQMGERIVPARTETASRVAADQMNVPPAVLPSAGKIPHKGDLTLLVKVYAAKARPLLHIILLFTPTLLIACLAGRSPAMSLGVILSVSIEAAQVCFGYGFDRVDVFDLLCDATGIALGLAAVRHPWLRERLRWSSEKPCRSVAVE